MVISELSSPEWADQPPYERVEHFLMGHDIESADKYAKYSIFGEAFREIDEVDEHDAHGWTVEETEELMQRLLGPSEIFASDYSLMDEEQKEHYFGGLLVSDLVAIWAHAPESELGHAA